MCDAKGGVVLLHEQSVADVLTASVSNQLASGGLFFHNMGCANKARRFACVRAQVDDQSAEMAQVAEELQGLLCEEPDQAVREEAGSAVDEQPVQEAPAAHEEFQTVGVHVQQDWASAVMDSWHIDSEAQASLQVLRAHSAEGNAKANGILHVLLKKKRSLEYGGEMLPGPLMRPSVADRGTYSTHMCPHIYEDDARIFSNQFFL